MTEAKSLKEAQPIQSKEEKKMGITVNCYKPLSEKLKANLIAIASKYYPTGTINVYILGIATYSPALKTLSSLEITYSGEEITGVGRGLPGITCTELDAFIEAFNKAKMRVATKQEASPVNTVVPSIPATPQTIQQQPPQPKRPVVTFNLSKFNGLELPQSATDNSIKYVRGYSNLRSRAILGDSKGNFICLVYGQTMKTNTHYLQIIIGKMYGEKQVIYKHRLRANYLDYLHTHLLDKFEEFVGLPELNWNCIEVAPITHDMVYCINCAKMLGQLREYTIKIVDK